MVLGISFIPGIDLYEVVLFAVEYIPYILAVNVLLFTAVKPSLRLPVFCAFPIFVIGAIAITIITSYEHALNEGYDISNPSLRSMLEHYIETGEGDLEDILESKKYPPVFGKYEVNYLIQDLLSHTLLHTDAQNGENIPVSYDKGNDWFRATLGEPMIYTSAIYKHGNESLWDGQMYKLDYVAHNIDLQPGDKVLDIGCGWGTLVEVFTNKYGAEVTGVTLSQEQVNYFEEKKRPGLKNKNSKVMYQDAMQMLSNPELKGKKFDKIVSLEMMEHVGIKRYSKFLEMVKFMLKDDGVFYMQVAGLRRDWRFKDFVWGLFMGEHIFPGADASVPLGWVSTHVERAGFEIQQVHNLGSHYSDTLFFWLREWRKYKGEMIKRYGINAYRRWEVFLRWSVKISKEGQSTVFMITTTKHNVLQSRLDAQKRLAPIWN